MSDDVMVRPVRTFLEGSDLKTPESEPFAASLPHARDLRNAGLATFDEPTSAETPRKAPAAPKSTGRRLRAS